MDARAIALGTALVLCVGTLTACGGSDSTPATPTTTLTEAEQQLGASLLSPAETLASVSTLSADELPPDTAATTSVDDADLPPTS